MSQSPNPDLDLTIARVIKAPRSAIWSAWTDPARFAQWWVPAPAKCKVVAMDLRAGGAFITEISDGGSEFAPHLNACFLAVEAGERIVFTTALTVGWRPAGEPFLTVTAIITLKDHALGTDYAARVLHKNRADRDRHDELGFQDGWGTCLDQLARLVERTV